MKKMPPLSSTTQSFFRFLCLITLFSLLSSTVFARPPLFQEPWGKDCDLKIPPQRTYSPPPSLATRLADVIIRFHQDVISPVDGPRSSFRPSSSRYMQLAMQRYGFIKGFIMGCDRLLRENDEKWIYPTIEVDGQQFKFDPALKDKYLPYKGK